MVTTRKRECTRATAAAQDVRGQRGEEEEERIDVNAAEQSPDIQIIVGELQREGGEGQGGEADENTGNLVLEDGDAVAPIDYTLGVPLLDTIGESFHCRLCAPIPKIFKRHGDLSKHLKRYHPGQRIVFKCNSCQAIFDTVKKCKGHQQKTPACRDASAANEERPQMPAAATNAAVVHRSFFHQRHPNPQPFQRTRPPTPPALPTNRARISVPRRPPPPLGSSSSSIAELSSDTSIVGPASDNTSSEPSFNRRSISTQTARPTVGPAINEHRARQLPSEIPDSPILRRISSLSAEFIELGQRPSQLTASAQRPPLPMNASPILAPVPRFIITPPKTDAQKRWLEVLNADITAVELEACLLELVKDVRAKAKIVLKDPPRRQQGGNNQNRVQNAHGRRRNALNAAEEPGFDAAEASRIQKLYRQCRPRAYREITEQTSPFCQIDGNDLHEHFTRVFGPSAPMPAETPEEIPGQEPPMDNNPLAAPFSPKEVWERLKRCSNTAPGPDGIRYAVWKKYDPGAHVLSAVFNVAQRLKHVPSSWNKSITVLLHKKGDRQEVSNWRPISLSDTIGKLHSSVLANRLATWAIANDRISTSQKGFMPVDGCAEHNFVLQSIIQDAKRAKRHCSVAWLDLTNAFGSIPHQTIFTALRWSGLSETSISIIRRLYASSYTQIRHSNGLTPEILIRAGVKQGCPLSPIIFNLGLEPIIRAIRCQGVGYKLHGSQTSVLAYADDLALVAESAAELQRMLDVTSKVATWEGLSFNARKCATLDLNGKRKDALNTEFSVQNAHPPVLTIEQFYDHLGVPTGYGVAQSANKVLERMNNHVQKINTSLLAPWQKFDAVNTFVLPCIGFHLKNGVVQKTPLNALDKKIRDFGKKWLNLPQRASVEPLYTSHAMGGMGLTPLNLLADISQLVHAYRLITSRDLSSLSMDLLKTVVYKRIRQAPRPDQISDYLNGSMKGVFRQFESTDTPSAWTRLRQATARLSTKLRIGWKWSAVENRLLLQLNNEQLNPKTAEYCLRAAIREFYRLRLLAKPDQGKVFAVTSAATASNHFMQAGNFTRFADWRFIHRARLDCVPLNATRRFGHGDKRCRRCHDGQLETLPHVLCHCWPHLGKGITRRHNAILDRLVKAFKPPPSTITRVNQTVPGFNEAIRPDLLAVDEEKKTVLIIDVAMPFENRYEAFERCRQGKRQKYEALADHYRLQGFEVLLEAFIVGPLGGWDPHNEFVLNQLKIGQHYRRLMRKLMVSDAIRWSRDIYIEHITGVPQFNDDGNVNRNQQRRND
uniref:Reverse transcriptase domain-containing protein n=1 Tax=Globodera pallida TaxID=36090 RepID=A0A183CIN3_GLOPA